MSSLCHSPLCLVSYKRWCFPILFFFPFFWPSELNRTFGVDFFTGCIMLYLCWYLRPASILYLCNCKYCQTKLDCPICCPDTLAYIPYIPEISTIIYVCTDIHIKSGSGMLLLPPRVSYHMPVPSFIKTFLILGFWSSCHSLSSIGR